jgi:hypothetical protein
MNFKISTKLLQNRLKTAKEKNNEASYCHFTVAWTVCFWAKPRRKLIERVYL